MLQTVWDIGGRQIAKSRKREDPYFWRGHMADAAMALIYRHWPTRKEVSRMAEDEKKIVDKSNKKKIENKKKRRLIGEFPGRR